MLSTSSARETCWRGSICRTACSSAATGSPAGSCSAWGSRGCSRCARRHTVTEPCIVLIGAEDLLPTLKDRTGPGPADVLLFAEADALRALEAITSRRPLVVAIEKEFAATPRGTALINRIKADPALVPCEIRIVAPDADPVVVPRTKSSHNATPQPLDQRGTRRAPRFRVAGQVEVLVDGNLATLVDLSAIGAQVLSPTVLKPNLREAASIGTAAASKSIA